MQVRSSGILLHISSLPSDFGIGDMGPWAFRFAAYLETLGQSFWQILPLSPTSPAMGNSPYSSSSAFAGNLLLLSPEMLVAEGYLAAEDLPPFEEQDPRRSNYEKAFEYKYGIMRTAFERCRRDLTASPDFRRFTEKNQRWLDDYALFTTLKKRFSGAPWTEWPDPYRDRHADVLESWRNEAAEELLFEQFIQYIFHLQWSGLKEHCNAKGISIIGDIPIYVTLDSADVWGHPEIFKLGDKREPDYVAGVPPDYFSKTGQRWGNPVYNWDILRDRNYDWWVMRMEHSLQLYDVVRLDHFRAFAAYWEVPAEEETAINGEWIDGPGNRLFDTLLRRMPTLPIIAEDLGYITADVRELKDHYRFPGMVILQFCFGSNVHENPYAPHMHVHNSVVYTGTHDNNTINGWFFDEAPEDDKHRMLEYAGCQDGQAPHIVCIRLAMGSVANLAIFPMQDILGLGADSRMNTPSTSSGNWTWRILPEELDYERSRAFHSLARLYGRA